MRLPARDVAGRSTELLLGRDDVVTDVSDHRGDVAGREDFAREEMDARCDVSGYSAGVTDAVYGGVTEPANIVHSVRRCADLRLHPRRRSNICVVEHSVNTSSANVNILSSGCIQTRARWWFIHQT